MHEKMLIKKTNRLLLTIFLSCSLPILGACSALEMNAPVSQAPTLKTENSVAAKTSAAAAKAPMAAKLSADQVYRVLAAETLVHQGQLATGAQVYFDLAQTYKDAGFAQRAYELASSAGNGALLNEASKLNTKLNPGFIESWQVQVVLALREHNVDAAVTAWEAFYQHSIDHGVSPKSIFLSTATLAQEDLDADTLVAFSERIRVAHPGAYAEFSHVMILASTENFSAAFDQVMRANLKYPDQSELVQLTTSLMLKLNDGRGLDWLQSYCERHPEDSATGEQLGRVYVSLQQLDAAKAQFYKITQAHPNVASAKISLALLLLELGDAAQAEALLTSLIDNKQYVDMARYYLGQSYYLQQKTDAAMQQWQEIKQGSYRLDAVIWQAQVLSKQQRYQQAQALLSAFKPENDDEQLRWTEASVKLYGLQGQFKEALKLLDNALFSMPEVASLWQERANVKYELGDYKGFEKDMRQAASLSPEDADVLNALGFYLADSKQSLLEARQLIEKANNLQPNKYYIIDSLGWLSYQEGKFDVAKQLLDRAYQLKADPEILRHRLATLLALKQRKEAQTLVQQEAKQFLEDKSLLKFLKQMSLMP